MALPSRIWSSLFSQLKEEKWAPDFGPATFVPTWGGTVTGVNHHLDHDEDRLQKTNYVWHFVHMQEKHFRWESSWLLTTSTCSPRKSRLTGPSSINRKAKKYIWRVDFPLSRVALNLRSKGRGPGQEGRLQECQGIGDQHFSTIMIIDEDGPITMIIIIAITIMIDKKYAQGGGWLRRTLPRSHWTSLIWM